MQFPKRIFFEPVKKVRTRSSQGTAALAKQEEVEEAALASTSTLALDYKGK